MAQPGLLHDTGLADFVTKERICVLSTVADSGTSVHAASILYYHDPLSLAFYMVTSRSSEKCRGLRNAASAPAAVVVGTYDHAPYTLQLRGKVAIVDYQGLPDVVAAYHAKRGNTNDHLGEHDYILLQFTPDWARYTDYAKGWQPVQIAL